MMSMPPLSPRSWVKRALAVLVRLQYGVAIYAVPVVIGLASVLALFAWEGQYATSGQSRLAFRVFKQTGNVPGPAQALRQLGDQPAVTYYDTKLSESPFWFSFNVQPTGDEDVTIEIPPRHAVRVACWDAARLEPLGSATRASAVGQVRSVNTGFAINLGKVKTPLAIVCQANFVGSARISVVQWPAIQFNTSESKYHRDAGLLTGGMVVLSVLVLATAIVNREWIYVLLAAWLMVNLRLAALSTGWDSQWLVQAIPHSWTLPTRMLIIVAYYIMTVTLFSRLFKSDLQRMGYPLMWRVVLLAKSVYVWLDQLSRGAMVMFTAAARRSRTPVFPIPPVHVGFRSDGHHRGSLYHGPHCLDYALHRGNVVCRFARHYTVH